MLDVEGEQVLQATVAAARDVLGDDLDAVFALGSLAHGGFAPLVSDVDVALVLTHLSSGAAERIEEVARRVRPLGPLAARLSVFWSDGAGVRRGGDGGRLPAVDRADLLDCGRLLHGVDRRAGAVRPGADELVRDGARFAATRFDDAHLRSLHDPEALLAGGVRPMTKAVLFPVRFLHTLATGRIGRNDDAVDGYRGAAAPLVQAAFGWRTTGLGADAGDLLRAHLVPLHLQFFDAYAAVEPVLRHRREALTNMGC